MFVKSSNIYKVFYNFLSVTANQPKTSVKPSIPAALGATASSSTVHKTREISDRELLSLFDSLGNDSLLSQSSGNYYSNQFYTVLVFI